MATRYDLSTMREDGNKTYWTRCGVMFPAKNGDGFTILLDALPINGKLIARPPKPRDGGDGPGGSKGGKYNSGPADDGPPPITDDDIPF